MTLQEFKAWFDGFTENIGSTPTEAQWKRIKERVAEIDDVATTYPVFIDRWWPQRSVTSPWWQPHPIIWSVSTGATSAKLPEIESARMEVSWDSRAAFAALGQYDAQMVV